MISLWRALSNKVRIRSAYRSVNGLGIEETVDEPFLDVLHQFAAAPVAPGPVPVALIEAFNEAQRRRKSRRKLRIASAALLGGVILIPGLAYAGVLPPPVARMVQRVLDVTRIPITLPARTTQSPADSSASSTDSIAPSRNIVPNSVAGSVPDLAAILPPLLPDADSVDSSSTWGVSGSVLSPTSGDGSANPAGRDQRSLPIDPQLLPEPTTPDATPTDTTTPDATPTDAPTPDATPTDAPTPDATPTDEPTPTDTPLEILPTP